MLEQALKAFEDDEREDLSSLRNFSLPHSALVKASHCIIASLRQSMKNGP
jgi:hypothetical protein